MCDVVFDTPRVQSIGPQSLRRCVPVDFYAVLLQLRSKQRVIVLQLLKLRNKTDH